MACAGECVLDTDLALVTGLVIAGFAIPSVMSALSESRAPRVASLAFLVGGAMVVWATQSKPGGYEINDVPDAFVRVVSRFLN